MAMDPKILSIHEVFGGGRRYVIPAYQRPYRWDDENVEQLIYDINDSRGSIGDDGYFVGSLICIKGEAGEFEVVDGQQRLITFTLIFRQLAEYLPEGDAYSELKKCYLKVKPFGQKGAAATPVIKARESEQGVYGRVLDGDRSIQKSKLSKFEKVFTNNAKSIKKCLDEIFGDENGREERVMQFAEHMFERVNVIFLAVDDKSASFRLFNVLNNRGTPLNDADLLKNILMAAAQGDDASAQRVESAWRKIEECTDETDVNTFLTINQISKKRDRDRANKQNYQYYEDLLKNSYREDSVTMAESLLRSAQHYQELMGGKKGVPKTINHLLRLNTPKEWLPAFLAFFNKCDEGVYKEDDFPRLVALFEKVYMHRFIVNLSVSQRELPCYYAIEAINNKKEFDEVMASIKDQSLNEKFQEALDSSLFYDASRPRIINLAKCVLLRIEDARHDDSFARHYDLRKITVEHVMPQSRKDKYWEDKFSEEQHEQWLHRIGNLTLLSRGKNSAARDFDFGRKKDAYEKANQKSGFEITKEICLEDEWNLETLEKRHENLKREIIALWGIDPSSD